MKKQNTQSKVIVALTAVVLLLVALSATLTFAYFTATKNASSDDMTFGKLTMNNITLGVSTEETHISAVGTPAVLQYLVPGCKVSLDGNVDVVSNIDSYVRFKVGIKVTGEGASLEDAQLVKGALSGVPAAWIPSTTVPDALDSGVLWTAWYYTKVAAGNGTDATTALDISALKLTFPATTMGNTWQNKTVTIQIKAEAIQAEHLVNVSGDVIANGPVVASNAPAGSVNVADLEAATAWSTVADNGVKA